MSPTDPGRDPVEELAEEFLDRRRRGELPSIAEYAERYPEHEDAIRSLFPALVRIEQLKPGPADPTGPAVGTPVAGLEQLGDFRILREVGRGGMGVVYEAEQVSLGRHVALKVMSGAGRLDPRRVLRFEREARAVARLHHTNIVPVYGVGEEGGVHYYVMQFIPGIGLDSLLNEVRRLRTGAAPEPTGPLTAGSIASGLVTGSFEADATPAQSPAAGPGTAAASLTDSGRRYWESVARLGMQVAEALEHAHRQGVLHRDIKPSNLLIDARGAVWVTDFGLAKAEGDPDDLTQSRDLVGTLRYMAPERFGGKSDGRADVYALGLTLYEMLTLRPAYTDSDSHRLIQRITSADPPAPRRVDRQIPRDLETVVLKAIARDPARRYQTPGDLAADLQRFLEDRPVRARRSGPVVRFSRWCQRNPAVASLSLSLLASLLVGLAGVAWKWLEARGHAADARLMQQRAESGQAAADRARVAAQRQLAWTLFDRGVQLADQGNPARGAHWLVAALRTAPEDDADLRRVARVNLSAWLGHVHGQRSILAHPDRVSVVDVSSDGSRFATGCWDGKVRVWDLRSGSEEPDLVLAHPGPVDSIELNADATRIAVGLWQDGARGEQYLWDLTELSPRQIDEARFSQAGMNGVTFAPDGRSGAVGGSDGTVRTWREDGAGLEIRLPVPTSFLGFTPDGSTLLTGHPTRGGGFELRLWDVDNGHPSGPPRSLTGWRPASGFGPDGRTIWVNRDATARRFDPFSGTFSGDGLTHPDRVTVTAWSPDGGAVVTGSVDGKVRVWDVRGSAPDGGPLLHPAQTAAVAADARTAVTGSHTDRTARVWQFARSQSRPPVRSPAGAVEHPPWFQQPGYPYRGAAISADGRTAVARTGRGSVRLWDVAGDRPVGPPLRTELPRVRVVALAPSGRVAAAGCDWAVFGGPTEAAVHLWDADTGQPLGEPIRLINWCGALAFRPDGRVLAVGDYSGGVSFWDVPSGRPAGPPLHHADIVLSLAYAPDGQTLAVGTAPDWSHAARVHVWDVTTRRELTAKPLDHENEVQCLAFSPDGRRLLTAGPGPSFARLWDAVGGYTLVRLLPQPAGFGAAAFLPDGRLLTGSRDGTARLWDSMTGIPDGPPMTHFAAVESVGFSPDGGTAIVGCADGTARLWDLATKRSLGPPLAGRGPVTAAAVAAGGVVTVAGDGTVRRWQSVVGAGEEVNLLELRLAVRTGLTMSDGQAVVPLSPEEWAERRRRLVEQEGTAERAYDQPATQADWHDARARDAEQDGDGASVAWHLDRLIGLRPGDWRLHARRARAHLLAGRSLWAWADQARAAALAPPEVIDEWVLHQAEGCLEREQWAAARWYLDRAIAARPDDWRLYAARARALDKLGRPADQRADRAEAVRRGAGRAYLQELVADHARTGEWADALALLVRSSADGAVNPHHLLIAALKAGQQDFYRQACRSLAGGLLQSPPPAAAVVLGPTAMATVPVAPSPVAGLLLWTAALGPEGVGEYAPLVELARGRSPDEDPRRWRTLGALLYRGGRFAEAVPPLEAAAAGGQVPDRALLAMAYHGSDRPADASRLLALLDTWVPADNLDPLTAAFWQQAEAELLRDEARRLIRVGGK